MSQPDESHGCAYCGDEHPRRVACPVREPEPDLTCPGCEGDGLCHYDDALPGEPCDWCGGSGVRLPGGAATDSADRSGESRLFAGGRGTATVPGPA